MSNPEPDRTVPPPQVVVPDPETLPSNWGRWGPDDELGTLNFITEAARKRGAGLARTGRTVSLACPITPVTLAGGPVPQGSSPMPTPVLQVMNYTGPFSPALSDVLVINTHHVAITHIDALAHISVDGLVYPGVPVERATAGGTVRHGSTTAFVDGITTRGVLLDLAPGGGLAPDHVVTGADLDEAAHRGAIVVESGDAVVVRGGWTVSADTGGPLPRFGMEAVRWLADHEVSLLASDIGDLPRKVDGVHPLHQVALARLGLPLIDGADVAAVTAACTELRRWEFLFVVAAMAVHGCTGMPVNPIALF